MNLKFVDIQEVKSIPEYILHLVTHTVSLATLIRLQMVAMKQGLLDEEQTECAQAIIWEARRLVSYIQNILDKLTAVHPVNIEEIINQLKCKIE